MALAGLKKQFNKANQYMSEKIGGAEGTKFTDEFTQLERKTDLTNELVEELLNRTKEYLQPNPASRTKLMVSSKLKGAPGKPHTYPQPEGLLGEVMCKYGKELNEDSNFAQSLAEMGEAMKEMAEVKYALEDNVKQNFLEPLTHLQAKDLKDVLFHRKKLEGRRLDFDCKKRKRQKGTHVTEEEIRMSEEKFEESFNLASMGMHNLLQNEIEQLSQICVLSEALYEYHTQCANILESLNSRLIEIKNEAAQRSFQPYVPKKLADLNLIPPSIGHDDLSPGEHQLNGSRFYSSTSNTTTTAQSSTNQSLNSKYKPAVSRKPSNSSSISSNRSTNGRSNGHQLLPPINSTTAYLLAGKAGGNNNNSSNGTAFPSASVVSNSLANNSHFSKSLLNVSSANNYWNDGGFTNRNPSPTPGWNVSDNRNGTTGSDYRSSNYDLLSGLKFESTTSRQSYRNSYHSSTVSPSGEHPPKPNNLYLDTSHPNSNLRSTNARTPTESRGPCCQALYDFDAENENELSFKEGDIIQLVSQVDENWYEGSVNGRNGLFPVAYVQVVVPISR